MTAAMSPLRVGTRGSPLALIQTRLFIDALRGQGANLAEQIIRTTGDAVQDRRLGDIGGKGLFAKEIHEALLDRRIDFAAHSLKDLETTLPPGIVLGCVLPREDPRDSLILRQADAIDPANPLASLQMGSRIGTASVRRQAQLLHACPDLAFTTLRGSVETRLAKLSRGDCDATLLAQAGLIRLGTPERASAVLDADVMVPAAGQGIIGITLRESDSGLRAMLTRIDDRDARLAATAERSLQARLDGSCRTPIAAYAHLVDGVLHLTGLVGRTDGSFLLKRSLQGAPADADRIGSELGASLRGDSPPDIFD